MEILIALVMTGIIIYQNLHIRELTAHNTDLKLKLSKTQLKNYAQSTPNPNDEISEAHADWDDRIKKVLDGAK